MNSAKPITVLLADDHMIIREGLRSLLQAETDIELVGEAANGLEAVKLAQQLRPEVVVMDMAMPMLNGLEATRQILKSNPGVKMLILSAHSEDAYVDSALEAGVSGYLLKQDSIHFLSESIRAVQQGHTVLSSSLAQHIKRRGQELPIRKHPWQGGEAILTDREAEVLQLTAEGFINKEIAATLGISAKTSEKHRYSIMHKLDLHSTASMTRYAMNKGVIESQCQLAAY